MERRPRRNLEPDDPRRARAFAIAALTAVLTAALLVGRLPLPAAIVAVTVVATVVGTMAWRVQRHLGERSGRPVSRLGGPGSRPPDRTRPGGRSRRAWSRRARSGRAQSSRARSRRECSRRATDPARGSSSDTRAPSQHPMDSLVSGPEDRSVERLRQALLRTAGRTADTARLPPGARTVPVLVGHAAVAASRPDDVPTGGELTDDVLTDDPVAQRLPPGLVLTGGVPTDDLAAERCLPGEVVPVVADAAQGIVVVGAGAVAASVFRAVTVAVSERLDPDEVELRQVGDDALSALAHVRTSLRAPGDPSAWSERESFAVFRSVADDEVVARVFRVDTLERPPPGDVVVLEIGPRRCHVRPGPSVWPRAEAAGFEPALLAAEDVGGA